MKHIFTILVLFFIAACGGQDIVNYPAKEGSIVAFGDSLTYGQGVSAKNAYPALLAEKWQREVINLGVSGDTSLQGLARKEEIKTLHPSFVLIEFGANDLFKRVPREKTQAALKELVDYTQNLGAVVVLLDTGGNSAMNPYKKMLKKIAKEKQTLYVDGIMNGIFNNRSLKSDNLHPNEQGYKKIADKIDKVVRPYL